MSKKNKNYLNNKEMLEEITKCQAEGVISDKLGSMFMLLAERYARHPRYSQYSYKDEMISNAILSCVAAFDKFDPSKTSNPFGYFSMCIYHSFVQILNKERKHQVIRDELLLENNMNPSNGYMERYEQEKIETKKDEK